MRFVVPQDALSWVDYPDDSQFPIQNLPFGVMMDPEGGSGRVPVVAIGEYAINLRMLANAGLLDFPALQSEFGLDPLLQQGQSQMTAVRKRLYELLHEDEGLLQDNHDLQSQAFHLIKDVSLAMPFTVSTFVDFYSGIHHASNVGRMFRPDQPPLLPNYRWIPIGYNGRASTVVVSGTNVTRPNGQTKGANDEWPVFGPTQELDFELEFGYALCGATEMGTSVSVEEAEQLMAGMVIVNDWSARDMQRWEYQPLGPFLAKSFATTISPWLVTLDALEPFRIPGQPQDPQPLDYLKASGSHHFDIQLEVAIQTPKMASSEVICRSNTKHLYWSMAQQLAHQSSNGTALRVGDLYATGTISGEETGSFGSLLELTWRGQNPIQLSSGETRTFLNDGDEITMSAFAQGNGFRIGFGDARGKIVGAPTT